MRRPALRRPRRRFSGRREAAIGLGAYAAYLLVRQLVIATDGAGRAARNARRLEVLERRLGIHVEPAVQRPLLHRQSLLRVLGVGYVTLNVVLTVGTQMRLFFRRHPDYHRLRTATAIAIVAPQPVFLLFPADPPRKLEHMVDTIAESGDIDLESGLIVRLYNPVAAFPSIHLAFAVVTSAAVRAGAAGALPRALALAYPPAVAYLVVVTANHFVLDAAAGAALGLVSLRLGRAWSGS
jgi:hypothetical protein